MFCLFFIFFIFNVKSPECSTFKGKKFQYVEITKSQISNGGYGVYATRFIKKGTRLEVYDGDWYKGEEFAKLSRFGHFGEKDLSRIWDVFIGGQLWHVNANSQYGKWPTCVNDNYNTKFGKINIDMLPTMSTEDTHPTLWYVATRDIHKGEELFVSYGKQYWSNRINIVEQYWSNPNFLSTILGITYWTN